MQRIAMDATILTFNQDRICRSFTSMMGYAMIEMSMAPLTLSTATHRYICVRQLLALRRPQARHTCERENTAFQG